MNAAFLAIAAVVVCAKGVDGGLLRRGSRTSVVFRAGNDEVANDTALSHTAGDLHLGKPVRLGRGGDRTLRIQSKGGGGPDVLCYQTTKADSSSDRDAVCPRGCPFEVQDRMDDDFCTFSCVQEFDCKTKHPGAPIPDHSLGVCRDCVVDGCAHCDRGVTYDKCAKCQRGYELTADGQCESQWLTGWVYIIGIVLLGIAVLVVVWAADMAIRHCSNAEGLATGLDFRERSKLRMDKNADGERKPWPLTTNLMKTQVAGPGMTLLFNFQVAVILWAVCVAVLWMSFAAIADSEWLVLGTHKFGTSRQNCIVVAHGHEKHHALMWAKVLFLWIVYLGSFAMCLGYGVYQLRAFQEIDYQHKTFKDFSALVVGLPRLSGDKPVEELLKRKLQQFTGQAVVGVSVAWDFKQYEKEVMEAVHKDLVEQDPRLQKPGDPPEMGAVRKMLFKAEQSVFSLLPEDEGLGVSEAFDPINNMLIHLHTSPRAFAVFETQEGMEAAVERVRTNDGFFFEGTSGVKLKKFDGEPGSVQWANFGHDARVQKTWKLLAGFLIIAVACLVWAVVFYLPYAWYVMSFNYENGRQPGFAAELAFSAIVVVGNGIMYEVCAQLSDWVGFRFKDNREACEMILYTTACMFNVALDFVTTYRTAELIMEALEFRTYEGKLMSQVTHFHEKFETYGMQRVLGENMYSYAFPATFLLPFLLEPFLSILGPLLVGWLVVRNHPEVQGRDAEEWLSMAEMSMGRYADLLLNVILAIIIFFFPAGYTWMLFLALAGSHAWIYLYDHYRVLRSIPACVFATFDIEWWAQAMLAPILGMVAAAIVFKSNCHVGPVCVEGPLIIAMCVLAWLLHTVTHLLVLILVIPKMGKPPPVDDPRAGETYKDLCQRVPCNLFNANPVFCLRSKRRYKHSPPCNFFVRGREHLMKSNPAIGCRYDESPKAH